jgi:multiple sugar transport system substrate-binding protein
MMPKPGKKVLITVSAACGALLAAIVILFSVFKPFGGRHYGPPPRITVNFPESGAGAATFRKVLVPAAKKDKGYYIYVESLPEQEYARQLPARLADPVSGDLYYVVNNGDLRQFAGNSLLKPLTPAMRKKWKADLPEVFYTLGPTAGKDPFYIPVSWYPWGFYYRKSVFAEAGVEPPENWDDFLTVCEVLKKRGVTPIGMTGAVKWPLLVWFDYLVIRLNGADYHARWSVLDIPFTDPGIVKVTDTLLDLVKKGYLQVDMTATEWEILPGDLMARKTGMVLCGSFFMERIPETQRDDIGWFSFPVIGDSEKIEIVSSSGFVYSAVAPNPDNALALLDYMLEPAFQKRLVEEKTGMQPILPKLVKDSGRQDLTDGYQKARESARLFEMSERNMDNRMILPLKAVITNFLVVDSRGARDILTVLEEERRRILLGGK